MIRKLRKKFIIINMTLVSLVLVCVFLTISFSTYQQLRKQSVDSMQRVLSQNPDSDPFKPEIGGFRPQQQFSFTPVFSVILNSGGSITDSYTQNVSVSDDVLQQAAQKAFSSGRSEGILLEFNLRYLRQDSADGIRIAFADMTGETDSMQSLIIRLLLIGAGGLAAFFLISLFLSGWALRPVEKAWRQQRQFTADASHELKTPLTVILANTGILLSHKNETIGGQEKWVENTRVEATRMKKLVDDLLFLAKSDDARLPAVYRPLDFSDTVLSGILPFEAVAYEQKITIQNTIEKNITVSGDSEQLKQLIFILMDNACKYTPDGGEVTVTLSREQDKARLAVTNTGGFIEPEDLAHIFERFYRSDKSRARMQGGYGLGLAIAKSIIDKHRGSISAVSSEHSGTTFTVVLPVN